MTAPGLSITVARLEQLQADGSCRRQVGVWGDRSCPELAAHVHCRNCPVYARIGRNLLDREVPAPPSRIRDATRHATQEATQSVIVFRAGAEWLALPTSLAREVIVAPAAHRVPHRNDPRFRGLVNVRGELLPMVDMRAMLGAAESSAEAHASSGAKEPRARLLVLERDGASWALGIAAIDDIHRIAPSALRPPPVTVQLGSARFTQAMFTLPIGQVGLIDAELLWYALNEICR